MNYKGIDASSYQGKPDWKQVKESGIEFAIIRILNSKGVDDSFEHNYKGCQDNGIAKGVYRYSYALTEAQARQEAQEVIQILSGRDLDMGVWLDLEWSKQRALSKSNLTKIAKVFIGAIEEAGYTCGIYCNRDWYKNVLDTAALNVPYWIARYPAEDDGSMKESLRPNVGEVGWQYSSKGRVTGINGNVDMNTWYEEIIQEGEKDMAIMVGSARRDERGKYVGGAAGDQDGGEVSTQAMYKHGKGWYVLRPKSTVHADALAAGMLAACANPNIGYDQGNRLGVIKYGTGSQVKTECDCSSLVRQLIIEKTGKDPGNFTTANEASCLERTGLFEKRVAYVNQTKTPVYNGDVLVTKSKGHTVIVVSGNPRNQIVKTEEEYDMPTIRKGLKGKAVKIWQVIVGANPDGDFGSKTDAATRSWQTAHGLVADGIVGEKSWKAGLESV